MACEAVARAIDGISFGVTVSVIVIAVAVVRYARWKHGPKKFEHET